MRIYFNLYEGFWPGITHKKLLDHNGYHNFSVLLYNDKLRNHTHFWLYLSIWDIDKKWKINNVKFRGEGSFNDNYNANLELISVFWDQNHFRTYIQTTSVHNQSHWCRFIWVIKASSSHLVWFENDWLCSENVIAQWKLLNYNGYHSVFAFVSNGKPRNHKKFWISQFFLDVQEVINEKKECSI